MSLKFNAMFSSGRDYGPDPGGMTVSRLEKYRLLEEFSKFDPGFEARIGALTNRRQFSDGGLAITPRNISENPQGKDLIELAQDDYLKEMYQKLGEDVFNGLRSTYQMSRKPVRS